MRLIHVILLAFMACETLEAQVTSEGEESKIKTLLSGRKNPGDEALIVSLGPHTLDVLTKWLEAEKDQIKLPGYSRLVGVRLRQFAEEITPQKRSEVLAALCARIREIEDKGSTANLIQASLRHLEGVKHPLVLELADFYLTSDLEGTRNFRGT